MLTDFGSRWREWDVGRRKKEREGEMERGGKKIFECAGETKEGEKEQESKEQHKPQPQPEEERPVPGMNGLTVEFVREVISIYNKDINRRTDGDGDGDSNFDDTNKRSSEVVDNNEEEIYSDRLPIGRYV
jgi:hypothetical protein